MINKKHCQKEIIEISLYNKYRKIRPETGQEQSGFNENIGIEILSLWSECYQEQATQMQKNLYLYFIDYAKAQQKDFFELLWKLVFFGEKYHNNL